MTHRNADVASVYFPSHWTPEEARAWIDTVVPPKHRNADQRIRDAFDALRAEIEDIFGKPHSDEIAESLEWLEAHEQLLHDFAKLPADA